MSVELWIYAGLIAIVAVNIVLVLINGRYGK